MNYGMVSIFMKTAEIGEWADMMMAKKTIYLFFFSSCSYKEKEET